MNIEKILIFDELPHTTLETGEKTVDKELIRKMLQLDEKDKLFSKGQEFYNFKKFYETICKGV